ncbi:MAG: M23 family metallopeptidase [Nocardioidaceae bacterium]
MSRALKVTVVLALLGGLALVGMTVMLMAMVVTGADTEASAGQSTTACSLEASGAQVEDLDEEQVENARTLIAVGKDTGVPPRGWTIAIAVALQESGMRNLDFGDRDSLGMMQQRPSSGWGTPDQVQDPAYAARAFYGGPGSPTKNPGLLSISGWEQMPLWEASQSVQRSAFPMAYAQHESLATSLVKTLSGETSGCAELARGPWQLPVQGTYRLTSTFGPRTSPTRGGADMHTGEDFAAPTGTVVLAVSSGRVSFTGVDGGYGNLVRVTHADGVESWYAHLSKIDVRVGDEVAAGMPIGAVGSTGNSTGPHLHLEIRIDSLPSPPLDWLRRKGLEP